MSVEVKNRNNFNEYDPAKTAYVVYEQYGDLPDFSTFTYGTKHSIVLRNRDTGILERIEFIISGDDGRFFPEGRRLWGDIVAEDSDKKNCILCFYFQNSKVNRITASFCGKSMPIKRFNEISKKVSCAAEATKYDPFYMSHKE